MHEPQKKMCVMCMVLSPNCCAVTIFEYSTTEVTLPSCLSVPSEHVAPQSKWQSADLDLLELAKRRKCGRRYSEVTSVSAILGRKCTARLKVNQNTRSPPLTENINLEKRMRFSVLGSLRTAPLHSTLAVNNFSLKFVS